MFFSWSSLYLFSGLLAVLGCPLAVPMFILGVACLWGMYLIDTGRLTICTSLLRVSWKILIILFISSKRKIVLNKNRARSSEGQSNLKVKVIWRSWPSEGQGHLNVKVIWRACPSEGKGHMKVKVRVSYISKTGLSK